MDEKEPTQSYLRYEQQISREKKKVQPSLLQLLEQIISRKSERKNNHNSLFIQSVGEKLTQNITVHVKRATEKQTLEK